MPREIHAKSTQNSRNFETQTAGGKIYFWSQDLIALSDEFLLCLLGLLSSFVATGSRELLNSTRVHDSPVSSLCTTTDGQYVATASWGDICINLRNVDRLDLYATLIAHTSGVQCVVTTGMHVLMYD